MSKNKIKIGFLKEVLIKAVFRIINTAIDAKVKSEALRIGLKFLLAPTKDVVNAFTDDNEDNEEQLKLILEQYTNNLSIDNIKAAISARYSDEVLKDIVFDTIDELESDLDK